DGTFFHRPDRFTGDAIEHVEKRLLGRLRDCFDGPAVNSDVDEDRRARDVEVPDAMVHQLVVPLPLTRSQIDRDETLAEQTVAGTMTAVVVARWQFNRQIRESELLVDRNLPPHAGIAGIRPRVALPRVVAELAETGNRVEDPEALSRADVEPGHVAFHAHAA